MIAIRTGNNGLAVCQAQLDPRSHTGDTIPFALDQALPDHVWGLYIDGRRVGALREIQPTVIQDIRKAMGRVHEPEVSAPPPAVQPPPPVIVPPDGGQVTFGF